MLTLQRASLLFFSLLVTSCGSTGLDLVDRTTGNRCDFLPEAPQPGWVMGDSHLVGFYTGIGFSEALDGKDQALDMARQNAKSALAGNIRTEVKQVVTSSTRESTSEDYFLQQQSDVFYQSIVDGSLRKIEQDALWLDRDGCRLWMRVKVSESSVEQIQREQINQSRLDQAKLLHSQAKDIDQTPQERSTAINEALRLLASIDFTALKHEDRTTYQTRFSKLQRDLINQLGNQSLLIVTLSDEQLPRAIHKEIAYRLAKEINEAQHIYPAPCNSLEDCLKFARSMGAQTLMITDLQLSVRASQMGSHLGRLQLDAELYKVSTHKRLGSVQNQSGEVLTFNINNLNWSHAVDRIFIKDDSHAAMNEFLQRTRRCATETC